MSTQYGQKKWESYENWQVFEAVVNLIKHLLVIIVSVWSVFYQAFKGFGYIELPPDVRQLDELENVLRVKDAVQPFYEYLYFKE